VRISYGNSVHLSVRLSRPGTDSSPCEIETSGLHLMIALLFLVFRDKISCS